MPPKANPDQPWYLDPKKSQDYKQRLLKLVIDAGHESRHLEAVMKDTVGTISYVTYLSQMHKEDPTKDKENADHLEALLKEKLLTWAPEAQSEDPFFALDAKAKADAEKIANQPAPSDPLAALKEYKRQVVDLFLEWKSDLTPDNIAPLHKAATSLTAEEVMATPDGAEGGLTLIREYIAARKQQEEEKAKDAPKPEPAPTKTDPEPPAPPAPVLVSKTDIVADNDTTALTTVVNNVTGEILAFDAQRALDTAKGKFALLTRLMQDKVLIPGVDYGSVPGSDKKNLLKAGAEKLLDAYQLFDKFVPISTERDWKNGFFFYEYECTVYDRETGKAIGSGIGSCNSMEKKYRFRWVTKDKVPAGMDLKSLPAKGGKLSEFEFAIDQAKTDGPYGKPSEYWYQFKSAIENGTAVKGERKSSKGNMLVTWEIDTTMYGIPNDDIFDLVNTISKMAQKRALVAAVLNGTGASAHFTQDMEGLDDFGLVA